MKWTVYFWGILGLCGSMVMAFTATAKWQRMPNTSLSNLPPQPPQFGYIINNAFPSATLNQPVCIVMQPQETNRLFIPEKTGNIIGITSLAAPNRTVLMSSTVLSDSESGMIGTAFHPGYATNRFFYIFSSRSLTTSQAPGAQRHQRISRFQTMCTNANVAVPDTELPLITPYGFTNRFDRAGNFNLTNRMSPMQPNFFICCNCNNEQRYL